MPIRRVNKNILNFSGFTGTDSTFRPMRCQEIKSSRVPNLSLLINRCQCEGRAARLRFYLFLLRLMAEGDRGIKLLSPEKSTHCTLMCGSTKMYCLGLN